MRLNDLSPEPLGLYGLATSTRSLIGYIKLLKLFTPSLCKSWALVRAHEGPFFILLNTLHEEVGDPESVEEITSSILFLAMVLAKLKIFKNV